MDVNEESLLRDCISIMQEERKERCFHYANGWMSTSKNVPEYGNIFIYVHDGPIIKFFDENKKNHEGIITAVNYLSSGQYNFSVFCYEYQIMGEDKEAKKYSVPLSFMPDFKFNKFV